LFQLLPWLWELAYIVGGLRTGLIVGGMLLFIALSEYWDRALITMYMATFAVLMASLNGIIVGSIFSQNRKRISVYFIGL